MWGSPVRRARHAGAAAAPSWPSAASVLPHSSLPPILDRVVSPRGPAESVPPALRLASAGWRPAALARDMEGAAGSSPERASASPAAGAARHRSPAAPPCLEAPLSRLCVGMWASRRHRACQLLLLPEQQQLVVLVRGEGLGLWHACSGTRRTAMYGRSCPLHRGTQPSRCCCCSAVRPPHSWHGWRAAQPVPLLAGCWADRQVAVCQRPLGVPACRLRACL